MSALTPKANIAQQGGRLLPAGHQCKRKDSQRELFSRSSLCYPNTSLTSEWIINNMNDNTKGVEESDEAILQLEVSDDALEAAASTAPTAAGAVMSFPNAPTV